MVLPEEQQNIMNNTPGSKKNSILPGKLNKPQLITGYKEQL